VSSLNETFHQIRARPFALASNALIMKRKVMSLNIETGESEERCLWKAKVCVYLLLLLLFLRTHVDWRKIRWIFDKDSSMLEMEERTPSNVVLRSPQRLLSMMTKAMQIFIERVQLFLQHFLKHCPSGERERERERVKFRIEWRSVVDWVLWVADWEPKLGRI